MNDEPLFGRFAAPGNQYTTASTMSPFDWDAMRSKMAELSERMKTVPTVMVMMTKTFYAMKDQLEKTTPVGQGSIGLPLSMVMGIPFEHYATMKECMDRVVHAGPNERPHLIADIQDITVDLMDHPYMRRQCEQLASKYGINHGIMKGAIS